MVTIEMIRASAVNAAAIKNAEGIIKKKKYKTLNKSKDDTYLEGVFTGSGASDYSVYVDIIDGIKPKCSCPSRQIPCKHALALMLLGVQGEIKNEVEIPEDVLSKREKREVRKEKAKEKLESGQLSKADISKNKLVLKGLEYLEEALSYIMKKGIKEYRNDSLDELEKIYKSLGDHKMTGTQGVFYKFKEAVKIGNDELAVKKLILLNNIVKKGKIQIQGILNNKKFEIIEDSTLDTLLATTRKIEELDAVGLIKENTLLMELSLFVKDRNTRGENYNGVYIDVETGLIYTTRAYSINGISISTVDTNLKLLQVKKFYIYPGKAYNKIKMGDFSELDLNNEVLNKILEHSVNSYKTKIKEVKKYFNNPLITEEAYILLEYNRIFTVEDCIFISNNSGEQLKLDNTKALKYISEDFKEGAILIKVKKNIYKSKLTYEGLTLISDKGIIYIHVAI